MVVDSLGFEKRFERFVTDLFRAEGFEMAEAPRGRDLGYDLFLKSSSGTTAVVQLKLYRTRVMPVSVIREAMQQVARALRKVGATRGIIAFPSKMIRPPEELLQFNQAIVIFDYDALAFLAAKYPALARELEAIVREVILLPEPLERSPLREVDTAFLLQNHSGSPVPEGAQVAALDGEVHAVPPADEVIAPPPGTALRAAIETVKGGRPGASAFEASVTNALQYLFENDLTAWSRQKVTEKGLSRYDLVARVNSEHDFWQTVVGSFRSRYIVFEFKNYTARITQGQIYTTEKYLFGTALRSTAIIISRNGADKNAEVAARGALREAGKLIVNLSLADLFKMLELRDESKDHNGVLVDYVDEMLMTLER